MVPLQFMNIQTNYGAKRVLYILVDLLSLHWVLAHSEVDLHCQDTNITTNPRRPLSESFMESSIGHSYFWTISIWWMQLLRRLTTI